MRAALILAGAIIVVAGTVTWVFDGHSSSTCSDAGCVEPTSQSSSLYGCTAFSSDCRARDVEAHGTTPGAAQASVSCNAPCMTQDGQIVATRGGGDPWWLWGLWIAIAAGAMVWGFRRELRRLLRRFRVPSSGRLDQGPAARLAVRGVEDPPPPRVRS